MVDETTAVAGGWTTISYFNEVMGLDLPSDAEFETVAGLIHADTGRVPEEGDRVELGDVVLTVLDATPARIRRVRVERVEGPADATPGSASRPGSGSESVPGSGSESGSDSGPGSGSGSR